MTQEEFLDSQRKRNFDGKLTDEEEVYWKEQSLRRSIENSSAFAQQIRLGFPPSLAYERIKTGSHRIDEQKDIK